MNDNINLSAEWSLHNVTVTSIADRGPVFSERGISLKISEGRQEQYFPAEGRETKEVWEYQLNFYVLDGQDPLESKQSEGMAAIVGDLPDGRRCKIHGRGWVGRDNFGQIEGTFFVPPSIEIADAEDDLMEKEWR